MTVSSLRQWARLQWWRALEWWFGPPSPHRPRLFNRWLRRYGGAPFRWAPADAETDLWGAARVALGLLQRAGLRRRFPLALTEGAGGAYARWLAEEWCLRLARPDRARGHFRAAFAANPGAAALRVYWASEPYRRGQPLALTPGHRRDWLAFLLGQRAQCGLRDEEVWWHLFEAEEDPRKGLGLSWSLVPELQRRFPGGLERQGAEVLAWARQHSPPPHRWLARVRRPAAPAPAPPAGGVNLIAPFCYPSGLSEAAGLLDEALRGAGVAVARRRVPGPPDRSTGADCRYLDAEPHPVSVLVGGAGPSWRQSYSQAGLWPRPGPHRVAVWYWELERFAPDWLGREPWPDEVWAPTRFIARAMRAVAPVPVLDMLPGVRPPEPAPCSRQHFGLPEGRFLFHFAFDVNSALERKNPLGLIRAFRRAFAPSDPVALVIKVLPGRSDPEGLEALRRACARAGVVLFDRLLDRREAYGLMNLCDAYVSLHRSEGLGLTLAEAMLLGKPVIATAYSGNLDFMTRENSFLVDHGFVPVPPGLPGYPAGCAWAEPDLDRAARLMRQVYESPEMGRRVGERARRELSERLSPAAYGRRLRARLDALADRRAA